MIRQSNLQEEDNRKSVQSNNKADKTKINNRKIYKARNQTEHLNNNHDTRIRLINKRKQDSKTEI